MQTFTGKGASGGIAVGKIHVCGKSENSVKRCKVDDCGAEYARFLAARDAAAAALLSLYEKSLKEIGESNAAIFEIHRMMLYDEDYAESVENIIKNESVNAEYAVSVTADNFAQMFAAMDNEYMKARAADVKDISVRIADILSKKGEKREEVSGIILADDLAPSETVQLDKSKVLAFVTRQGSANSHTAILARMMNIPAVVSCDIENIAELDGREAAVDGFNGRLITEPDEKALAELRARQRGEEERRQLLESLKGKEDITEDGKKIMVYANIGGPGDLAAVLESDAGGIGLFRSEFLYLEKNSYPGEEEQFTVYKRVVQTMAGKRVIIRTLDIGADKRIDYFGLPEEENPALGYRAIRICLDRPEMFKTQLRAIFRAAAYGSVGIMYPMITSVSEIRRIKALTAEVRAELERQGVPCGEVMEGIMIETPAAAIISDMLAPEVDFFSIGTNDLSQYTLAADRQNPRLDGCFAANHPAVMRLIELVVKNAHKHGIWAGICGEMGADTSLTAEFLRMGVDELSVAPPSVLPIRALVRANRCK